MIVSENTKQRFKIFFEISYSEMIGGIKDSIFHLFLFLFFIIF